ncbi:MAG: hypothetical protein A2Z38_07330 [Planctomycetes bacterium RBG_19FT_COMBO_48_8]|nr:MAG: hypothetical protein A2Z38_07330 [Planctomycetes bacterium RBG_19FT_COMBO_48_8]
MDIQDFIVDVYRFPNISSEDKKAVGYDEIAPIMLEYSNGAKYRTLVINTQAASAATILKAFSPFQQSGTVVLSSYLLDKLVILLISQKDYEPCGNWKDWELVFGI